MNDWLSDPQTATVKYGAPIENWQTWRVTDMSRLFQGAESFTANLNGWDTSSVTDFHHMFAGCASFESALDGWDVSQVTDFSHMFYGATSFTGTSLDTWDTSSAQSMEQMFLGATNFVGPENIGDWDVSSVSTMYAMFFQASSFDRPVNNWDMSNVRYTNSLFEDASSFTQQVCWPTMNPRAKCFQCFCGTRGARFDLEASCPVQVHPSIQAYSQACDPDDILEELVATQVFGRPADTESMGGLDASGDFLEAIAGLPVLGKLDEPELDEVSDTNSTTLGGTNSTDDDLDLEVSDRGEEIDGDIVVFNEAQREVSAATSRQASVFVSLLTMLAATVKFQ